jgi:hypothetical protein
LHPLGQKRNGEVLAVALEPLSRHSSAWGACAAAASSSSAAPLYSTMDTKDEEWERRIAELWARAPQLEGADLVAGVDALADEREPDDAAALFERACARDTAGIEGEAEGFYRAALATGGLDPYRRCRASIQLASTLRILGQLQESEQLLVTELDLHMAAGASRVLHDEARTILALTYVAQGRPTEAVGLVLSVLAPRLSRYNRSMSANAAALVTKTWN